MRRHGTLVKWNDERGFGFIEPAQGPSELFVHISAFSPGGARPQPGELVSFELEVRADGKPAAVRVLRAGEPAARAAAEARRQAASDRRARNHDRSGFAGGPVVVALIALLGAGVYGYQRFSSDSAPPPDTAASASASAGAARAVEAPAAAFSCDGRAHCSQMRSCAEAVYFLRHCPNTQMDGDNDGRPCEQQCP